MFLGAFERFLQILFVFCVVELSCEVAREAGSHISVVDLDMTGADH